MAGVGAVLADEAGVAAMKEQGVRDSKLLSPARRFALFHVIKNLALHVQTLHIPAEEIDTRRKKKESLNEIERTACLVLLERLRTSVLKIAAGLQSPATSAVVFDKLVLDSVDVDAKRWGQSFKAAYPAAEVVSEHQADKNHVRSCRMRRRLRCSTELAAVCESCVDHCRRSVDRGQGGARPCDAAAGAQYGYVAGRESQW